MSDIRCLARNRGRAGALACAILLLTACGGGGGGDDPGEVPTGFVGTVFYQIGAGDLNDDGLADVAAIAVVQDGRSTTADPVEVQVLLQDALRPGRFSVAQRLTLSTPLGTIAVEDLDGDARDDIVVTEPSANRVRVFLQDPLVDGRFGQNALQTAGAELGALEVTDTNLDQAPDLVLTTRGGVEVLQQDPGAPGTFPFQIVVDASRNADYALSAEFDSLGVGDFDDNGLVDLFAARVDAVGRLYLHEAAVPGTFAPALDVGFSLDGLEAVVVADVTDDGLADVLVAKLYVDKHGYLEVVEQTGPAFGLQRLGVFAPLTLNGVDPYLRGFAVADLNADGLPDMAVADGELSVLLNDPAAPGQFRPARRLLE